MDTLPQPAAPGATIRVLQLIDSLTIGGAEALLPTLVDVLGNRNVEAHVCTLKTIGGNPIEEELRSRGVETTNLDSGNLRDLDALRQLLDHVRGGGYELIHAHLTDASIWGSLVSFATGLPLVATLHVAPEDLPIWRRRGLRERLSCRLLGARADRIVAVSEWLREQYVRRRRLDGERITVIHNGVDCRRFHPDADDGALRRELGIPAETPLLLAVAVLRRDKGLDHLLEAFRRILSDMPKARLAVVGDGPDRDPVTTKARALGVRDRCRFPGTRRDLPRFYAAADLLVSSSLDDALPTVLIEAMAAGLPAVATEVGGVPEIVVDGGTGVLVPPAQPGSLAGAVLDLLGDPEARSRLGKAARRRAVSRFSADTWAGKLEELYRSLVDDGRPAATTGEGATAS